MIDWKLQTLKLKDLKENPRNPREIDKQSIEKLSRFVEKFGLIDKPIINTDFTIVGGHQRVRILKKQKVKEVECWVPDRLLSDKEIDEMCIGLNLHQGKWDWDMLANEWEILDLLQYGFEEEQLTGHMQEAEEMLGSESEKEKTKKAKLCPHCGLEL
jgi:ParB-like nuclease domain